MSGCGAYCFTDDGAQYNAEYSHFWPPEKSARTCTATTMQADCGCDPRILCVHRLPPPNPRGSNASGVSSVPFPQLPDSFAGWQPPFDGVWQPQFASVPQGWAPSQSTGYQFIPYQPAPGGSLQDSTHFVNNSPRAKQTRKLASTGNSAPAAKRRKKDAGVYRLSDTASTCGAGPSPPQTSPRSAQPSSSLRSRSPVDSDDGDHASERPFSPVLPREGQLPPPSRDPADALAARADKRQRRESRLGGARDVWHFMQPAETQAEPAVRPANGQPLEHKPKSPWVRCTLWYGFFQSDRFFG